MGVAGYGEEGRGEVLSLVRRRRQPLSVYKGKILVVFLDVVRA